MRGWGNVPAMKPLSPVLSLVFLSTPALAHSPHDVANFVAVASDGTVWTTDTEVLAWSDDGFQFEFMYTTFGYPVCGFADPGRGLILATEEGGVWSTSDGGLTWAQIDGPDHAQGCGENGDVRLIAGLEGIWESVGGGDFEPLPELLDVRGVDVGGDRRVAWKADGGLFALQGAAWVELAAPPAEVIGMAVDDDGVVWIGVEAGLYTETGDTWAGVRGSPADGRALTIEGETVLVGTSRTGIWFSLDGGASWDLSATNFEDIEDGPGAPGDGVHFLQQAIGSDGTWWSAQWEGVWHLEAGESPTEGVWRQGAVDNIPRARTVQWLGPDDLLIGVYGGGIYRGTPGGQDWTLYAAGVGWPYPKQILATPELALVVSGVALYLSRDDGLSWTTGNVGVTEIGDHVAVAPDFPTTPNVLAAGRDDNQGLVVWSDDLGETWNRVDLPGDCSDKPTVVETDGANTWIGCGTIGEISHSADMGKTWTLAYTVGDNVNDILPEIPALFATDLGILSTSDGVSFTTAALEGTSVDRLVRGPDGTLWASVPGEGVGRIVGPDFQPCGWPVQDRVEDLTVGEDGALAAGTREGAWVSTDDCTTWSRANDFEFLDEIIQFWRFSDDWVARDRSEAWAAQDIGTSFGDGEGWAEVQFVGEQIRVRGSALDGASLRVTVDGVVEEVTIDAGRKDIGTLYGKDVPAGLHTVFIELLEGTVYLDGAGVWRQNAPALDPISADDTGEKDVGTRCGGCGGGGAAGVVLGLGWVWGRGRRRGPVFTFSVGRSRRRERRRRCRGWMTT